MKIRRIKRLIESLSQVEKKVIVKSLKEKFYYEKWLKEEILTPEVVEAIQKNIKDYENNPDTYDSTLAYITIIVELSEEEADEFGAGDVGDVIKYHEELTYDINEKMFSLYVDGNEFENKDLLDLFDEVTEAYSEYDSEVDFIIDTKIE